MIAKYRLISNRGYCMFDIDAEVKTVEEGVSLEKEINRRWNAFPKIIKALKEAEEHLDYCNYGDKWERECAIEAGLPKKIKQTLEQFEED